MAAHANLADQRPGHRGGIPTHRPEYRPADPDRDGTASAPRARPGTVATISRIALAGAGADAPAKTGKAARPAPRGRHHHPCYM